MHFSISQHSYMRQHYKIVLLGSAFVGKSSFILQQVKNVFPLDYSPSIEDHFDCLLHVNMTPTVIDVLDTSGHKDCSPLHPQWVIYAQAFIVVYSITDLSSWNECWEIYILIRKLRTDSPPIVLVANKNDLIQQRQVSTHLGFKLAMFMKCNFFEITATKNSDVKNVFNSLCSQLSSRSNLAPTKPNFIKQYCNIM